MRAFSFFSLLIVMVAIRPLYSTDITESAIVVDVMGTGTDTDTNTEFLCWSWYWYKTKNGVSQVNKKSK